MTSAARRRAVRSLSQDNRTASAAAAADRHTRQHHFLSTPAVRVSPLPALTEGRRVGRRATTGTPLIESAACHASVECQQSDARSAAETAGVRPASPAVRAPANH